VRLRSRPSSVHKTGRVIVLMQGPYDSRGKKVNEVNSAMFLVATAGSTGTVMMIS